jgi:heme/copper-type cytochrome/quinol oxidase subunit 2
MRTEIYILRRSNSTFWLSIIALTGVLLFIVVLIYLLFIFPRFNAQAQNTPKASSVEFRNRMGMIVTPIPAATPLPVSTSANIATVIAPFVGTWYKHDGVLIINADGHAHLALRAYQYCSETKGQPPCDSIKNGQFVYGIQEDIIITTVRDGTAYGTTVKSTVNPAGTKVTITTGANDTLSYQGTLLCGPKSPSGWCGA